MPKIVTFQLGTAFVQRTVGRHTNGGSNHEKHNNHSHSRMPAYRLQQRYKKEQKGN